MKYFKNDLRGSRLWGHCCVLVVLSVLMILMGCITDSSTSVPTSEMFAQALDSPNLSWWTGGVPSREGENVNWSCTTEDSCHGGSCAQSGAGGGGIAGSWLATSIKGPCVLSYHYKVQTYGGRFSVFSDSECLHAVTNLKGRLDWKQKSLMIESGQHKVRFEYIHPGQGFANQFNGVRIDKVEVRELTAQEIEMIEQKKKKADEIRMQKLREEQEAKQKALAEKKRKLEEERKRAEKKLIEDRLRHLDEAEKARKAKNK